MSRRRHALAALATVAAVSSSGCLSNALINLMAPPGSNTVKAANPLGGEPAVTGLAVDEDATCAPTSFQGSGMKVTVEDGKVCLEDRFIAANGEYDEAPTPMPVVYSLSTDKGRTEIFEVSKSFVGVEATCHPSSGGTTVIRSYVGRSCVDNTILAESSTFLAVEVAGLPGYELLRFAF